MVKSVAERLTLTSKTPTLRQSRPNQKFGYWDFLMPDAPLLETFRAFAGNQQFRAFVHALNKAPLSLKRLRYWQEELWKSFISSHPMFPADFGKVREAFRICELHGCRLLGDAVHAPAGQIQHRETQSPDHPFPVDLPGIEDCPHDGWGVDPAEWEGCGTRLIDIWYCPECRNRRAILEGKRSRTRSCK
jgi:hypothetical protein